MNKAILPLLFFLLLAIVFSGCLLPESEVVQKVKQSPSVASFLAAHPNAQLTFTPLNRQQSQARADEFIAKCGSAFAANDYYYILFSEGNDSVEVLVGQKTKAITCIHRSDDLCISDEACDDRQACTIDSCMGAPKECKHQQITQCAAGDGCCPSACDYKSDSDCEIPPPPECTVDSDCDDWNPATSDTCILYDIGPSGQMKPNKCNHELITECTSGDAYCPSGCNYINDSDCERASECTADANCNDNDHSTADKCAIVENANCDLYMPGNCLELRVCTHEKITKCISGDGYCPVACDNRTDWDCLARPGDIERITVKCSGNEAKIDGILFDAGSGVLKAKVAGFITNSNNKTLKSYTNKSYEYNDNDNFSINTNEIISIAGTILFDKETNKSKLYIEPGGMSYTVDLGEGIPVTDAPTNDSPFAANNDDKIIVPLFTTDSLVVSIDKSNGKIGLISNQTWLSATNTTILSDIEGKGSEKYTITVSRCDVDKMVFNLNKDTALIATQTAAVGDILFADRLNRAIRINYYNQNSTTGSCEYHYSIGDYLEEIYASQEFPAGSDSDWKAGLEFSGNRLVKITIENKGRKWYDTPLTDAETIPIIRAKNTSAENFCTLTFNGLTR